MNGAREPGAGSCQLECFGLPGGQEVVLPFHDGVAQQYRGRIGCAVESGAMYDGAGLVPEMSSVAPLAVLCGLPDGLLKGVRAKGRRTPE